METFQKGDIVLHKTNNVIPMIVIDIIDGKVKCRWIESLIVKHKGYEIKEFDFDPVEITKEIENTFGGTTF
ncbi:MAG: hypothetical protein PHN88_09080 [Ignavibacteria bacterium]|nr:hypothetical protein [Ignavibacteria bacterium]